MKIPRVGKHSFLRMINPDDGCQHTHEYRSERRCGKGIIALFIINPHNGKPTVIPVCEHHMNLMKETEQ